ncbi:MAG: sigma-70 family RNA polymerase sigma factor [Verrucomicrobiota bacterium]|nr:sigma-70 family RNA polymerase sigma factor [Verrucomicrobiota bacterium]
MIAEITDVDLLLQTAKGDGESLRQLYERFSGVLFSTAYRVLNNAKDAEEIVQEAFVQIWEKAALYDAGRAKPLTWAMTLTRNKAIDRLRRVQRRARLQDEVASENAVWERACQRDLSDAAVRRDAQQIVRSAVIQLSPDQRNAIELAFFSGLTQHEVAERLGEPLGTVKARIRRGMIKLRQLVEPKL